MKIRSVATVAASVLLAVAAAGCSTGKPGFRAETMRPSQVHDFATLYKQNCSACHGDKGMNGAALPLDNPVYLTWAGRDRILTIVENGVPHRLMPAFGAGGGGLLTGEQVEDIVNGMMMQWTKPGILDGANAPGYEPASAGNAAQGKAAFQIYCARCHGADGKGIAENSTSGASKTVVGSIVDPTYLSLISSQGLRDIVVSGMPGEGMPDWRGDVAGKPMSDQDVTNVVAWLTSQRVQFPGQNFSSSQQH
jgi:mono/diheme cytochrome c family protein